MDSNTPPVRRGTGRFIQLPAGRYVSGISRMPSTLPRSTLRLSGASSRVSVTHSLRSSASFRNTQRSSGFSLLDSPTFNTLSSRTSQASTSSAGVIDKEPFCCPFYAKDPVKYQACGTFNNDSNLISISDVKNHIRRKHTFRCSMCHRTFDKVEDHAHHMRLGHCVRCHIHFNNEASIRRHQEKNPACKSRCDRCHEVFEHDADYQEHRNRLQTSSPCRPEPHRYWNDLDEYQRKQVSGRMENMTAIQKWQIIFLIAWPDHDPTQIPSHMCSRPEPSHFHSAGLKEFGQLLMRKIPLELLSHQDLIEDWIAQTIEGQQQDEEVCQHNQESFPNIGHGRQPLQQNDLPSLHPGGTTEFADEADVAVTQPSSGLSANSSDNVDLLAPDDSMTSDLVSQDTDSLMDMQQGAWNVHSNPGALTAYNSVSMMTASNVPTEMMQTTLPYFDGDLAQLDFNTETAFHAQHPATSTQQQFYGNFEGWQYSFPS